MEINRGLSNKILKAKLKLAVILSLTVICMSSLTTVSITKANSNFDLFISNLEEPSSVIFDTVINNARLINPETNSDINGINIGILDGRVAALTYSKLQGKQTINASGLVAAPGFIDIDSKGPHGVDVKYKLADGVTTQLNLQGGTSNAKEWYAYYAGSNPLINYGASSFVTQIRSSMGYDSLTPMTTPVHIEKLCSFVETNIKEGALGISVSPEYAPGVQKAELQSLSKLAAKYNVSTYYNLRYSNSVEMNTSIKAIEEVIGYAEQTGAAVHILHISSTGSNYCAEEAFALIDEAREKGLDITADIYPYDLRAANLRSSRLSLTYNNLHIPNSTQQLKEATFAKYKQTNQLVVVDSSSENEVKYALKKPYVFIASDSIIAYPSDGHPRGIGSYSRLIGKYARDEGVIGLMDAIAKASYLPAKRLESASPDMKRKGRIELGSDADIVLFDYDSIIDIATIENVVIFLTGIKYVFVNGLLTFDNGMYSTKCAGKPILSCFMSPKIPQQEIITEMTAGEKILKIPGYRIYGNICVDLKKVSDMTGIPYEIKSDGSCLFGQVELCVGNRNGGYQKSNIVFSSEPVIYGGSIYFDIEDVREIVRRIG